MGHKATLQCKLSAAIAGEMLWCLTGGGIFMGSASMTGILYSMTDDQRKDMKHAIRNGKTRKAVLHAVGAGCFGLMTFVSGTGTGTACITPLCGLQFGMQCGCYFLGRKYHAEIEGLRNNPPREDPELAAEAAQDVDVPLPNREAHEVQ
jgi:hypothetical protein